MTKTLSPLRTEFQNLFNGQNLKARVARGSVWVGAGSGVDQALRLTRNMILTRLLAPEAFGLMAIVLAVNTFFESFTEVGIDTAIVQNPRGEEYSYLNAAWWLSTGRALGLYALIFISAPWVSQFYHQAALAPMMRVAFLATLFRGLMSPRTYVAHKKMDFKRLVAINQGGGVFGVLTTVVLAFLMPGVWALVIGFTVEAAARLVLSYLICPFWPELDFHRHSFREIYRFSRGMFGLPILTFIFMRADVFVIGKLWPVAALGIYSMASTLGQIPMSLIGTGMAQLMNPAISEIQNDHEHMKRTLLRITSMLALVSVPAVVYVALYGSKLLLVTYGEPYTEAAAPLAILFLAAMLRVATIPVLSLYFMTGQPHLNRVFAGVRTLVIVTLLYPATKLYGLNGAAATALLSMVIACVFQVYRLRDMIGLRPGEYMRAFARALPLSFPVIAVWIATHYATGFAPLTQVAIGGLACLCGFMPSLIRRAGRDTIYQH